MLRFHEMLMGFFLFMLSVRVSFPDESRTNLPSEDPGAEEKSNTQSTIFKISRFSRSLNTSFLVSNADRNFFSENNFN